MPVSEIQQEPIRSQAHRLPVWATFADILGTASSGAPTWARLIVLPFLLQFAILFTLAAANTLPLPLQIVFQLSGLLYVPAATAWIRMVVGGRTGTAPPAYRWGRREGIYLWRFVQLSAAVLATALLAAFALGVVDVLLAGHPAAFAALIAGIGLLLWVYADLVMVLPAAALGQNSSFRTAARLSHGQRGRIIAVGLLTALGVALLFATLLAALAVSLGAVVTIADISDPPAGATLGHLAGAVLLIVIVAVLQFLATLAHATALACVYAHLTGRTLRPA